MQHHVHDSPPAAAGGARRPQRSLQPLPEWHYLASPSIEDDSDELLETLLLDYLEEIWTPASVLGALDHTCFHRFIYVDEDDVQLDSWIATPGQLLKHYSHAGILLVYTHDPVRRGLYIMGLLRRRDLSQTGVIKMRHLLPLSSASVADLQLQGKPAQVLRLQYPTQKKICCSSLCLSWRKKKKKDIKLSPTLDVSWRWRLLRDLTLLPTTRSMTHEERMQQVRDKIVSHGVRRFFEDSSFQAMELESHIRCRLVAQHSQPFASLLLKAEPLLLLYKLCELYPGENTLRRCISRDSLPIQQEELRPATEKRHADLQTHFHLYHGNQLPDPQYCYRVPFQYALDFLQDCPLCQGNGDSTRNCSGLRMTAGTVSVSYVELPFIISRMLETELQQMLSHAAQRAAASTLRTLESGSYPVYLQPDPGQEKKPSYREAEALRQWKEKQAQFVAWNQSHSSLLPADFPALERRLQLDRAHWNRELQEERQQQQQAATNNEGGTQVTVNNCYSIALSCFPPCISKQLQQKSHLKFESRNYLAHFLSTLPWSEAVKRRLFYLVFQQSDELQESEEEFYNTNEFGLYFITYSKYAEENTLPPPSCKRLKEKDLCVWTGIHSSQDFVSLASTSDCGVPLSDIEDIGDRIAASRLSDSVDKNRNMCTDYFRTRAPNVGKQVRTVTSPHQYYSLSHLNMRQQQ